jgi:hypothetical protein
MRRVVRIVKGVKMIESGLAPAASGPTSVEQLLAHAQIYSVLVAYCQGVDRRDWDHLLGCYHPDAHESHGQYVGDIPGFVEWLKSNHENVTSSMHVLSNVSIGISEDDSRFARVESYCLSHKEVTSARQDTFFHAAGDDEVLRRTVALRYVDTFENRPGLGWRILARTVVFEWVRREPGEFYYPLEPAMDNSRRDSSDLLYAPLARPAVVAES